jgi:hypothetical protein
MYMLCLAKCKALRIQRAKKTLSSKSSAYCSSRIEDPDQENRRKKVASFWMEAADSSQKVHIESAIKVY